MIDKKALRTARGRLVMILIALAVTFGAYRMLHATDLNGSGLLFIGLPALLALVVALSPPAKTTVGVVFRTITLALLLTGIMFIEGIVCILLAAPIFYLVGLSVAKAIDWTRRDRGNRKNAALFLAPLILLSLEGTTPATSFDRQESVTAVRVVRGTSAEVFDALRQRPRFDLDLPPFLRIGFPRPGKTSGEGLAIGDRRTITFPTRSSAACVAPGTSTLEFAVAETSPESVRFEVVRDTTIYHQWLILEAAVVSWKEMGSGRSEVRWTLHFERRLDPIWYFSPLERYGTKLAAEYLIDTLATPQGR